MKKLIVTRSDDNIKEMTDMTFPIIKKFCHEWNADFIVLNESPIIWSDDHRPHFRILKIKELLNDYDRVLNLDSDIVINKTCPDVFVEVPENCIGTIYEDVGSRRSNRLNRIRLAQEKFGNIGWESGYINTGVFLVSRIHKEIFNSINGEFYCNDGSDDVHLGYQIKKLGFEVHELSYKFNHMSMFSENGENRFDSYIIHYAGRGIFDSDVENRIEQIKKDIKIIYG